MNKVNLYCLSSLKCRYRKCYLCGGDYLEIHSFETLYDYQEKKSFPVSDYLNGRLFHCTARKKVKFTDSKFLLQVKKVLNGK